MNKFQNLLGKSPIVSESTLKKVIEHELEIKNGLLVDLKSETSVIMKKLKNEKAAGLDGIPLGI